MDWRFLNLNERSILNELRNGVFQLTEHALTRMGERALDIQDIIECANTVTSVHRQSNKCFKIEGKDTMECEMIVIVDYDGIVLVVTVW